MEYQKVVVLAFFVTFHILLQPASVAEGRVGQVVLTEVQSFIHAPEIVRQFEIHLTSLSGSNLINGTFSFNRILMAINVKFLIEFQRPDKTRFQMPALTVDGCNLLLGDLGKQKFMKTIAQEIAKQKNLPQKCPLEANKTYSMVNYAIDFPEFPFPNLKFEIMVTFYDNLRARNLCELLVKGATKRKA